MTQAQEQMYMCDLIHRLGNTLRASGVEILILKGARETVSQKPSQRFYQTP